MKQSALYRSHAPPTRYPDSETHETSGHETMLGRHRVPPGRHYPAREAGEGNPVSYHPFNGDVAAVFLSNP